MREITVLTVVKFTCTAKVLHGFEYFGRFASYCQKKNVSTRIANFRVPTWYLPKNKEVPDHKFGVPPVRWYANYRTLALCVKTHDVVWSLCRLRYNGPQLLRYGKPFRLSVQYKHNNKERSELQRIVRTISYILTYACPSCFTGLEIEVLRF